MFMNISVSKEVPPTLNLDIIKQLYHSLLVYQSVLASNNSIQIFELTNTCSPRQGPGQIARQIIYQYLNPQRMNKNKITAVIIWVLSTVSLFFLVQMTVREKTRLQPTSLARFISFAICHIIGVVMMFFFIGLETTYDYVRWTLKLSAMFSLAITCAQAYIYSQFTVQHRSQSNFSEPLELGYLNCYFLIYMYSLISFLLSGLFVCLTKAFTVVQERRILRAIKESIKLVEYQQHLQGQDCPICLINFQRQEQLVQIKCRHVFHKSCLVEWIKVNQSCPNCRYNIFESLNEDEREEVEIAAVPE